LTVRYGTRTLHLTNFPQGGTWGPIEFQFYAPIDPNDLDSGPDLDNPLDLTGSTWDLDVFIETDTGVDLWGSFDEWDVSDQDEGIVRTSLTDTDLTETAAVGANCVPTYVFRLTQTRGSKQSVPYIGTIQVASLNSLHTAFGVQP
jgi:hypothetical protein